ncbi:zinc finger MSN2 [Fusarium heterosporum]|uniref:Zinc finger MSN2 n=1 Tax=Fusarium heterosporum TaxID=42747 RepID=A0A8H5WFN7_FUSHE|nr:zinc finger MSN2 [Fusarium heterosporum]
MEGWAQTDDPFFMNETFNFDSDLTHHDFNGLLLETSYYTNDASFADVSLDPDIIAPDTSLFDDYNYSIDPSLFNLNELSILETTNMNAMPMNWDFMNSIPIEEPSATTITGSSATTEPSECTLTYITPSTSMAQSPTEPLPLQTPSNDLVQDGTDKGNERASVEITRRQRTKMKPGTRPRDLKQVILRLICGQH